MSLISLVAGWATIAASVAHSVRFVLLKPEASAWPDTNSTVRAAVIALAGMCLFLGLQILHGTACVSEAVSGFLIMHAVYSAVLALNLFRQRHVTWLETAAFYRHREPTNAAG